MVAAVFPASLLARPWLERLAYFKDYQLSHPRLKETDHHLWRTINEPADASLIFLCGPTGVGKTMLRQLIEARLSKTRDASTHLLPVAAVEAVTPEGGKFSWLDFYKRALIALEQPFIENRLGVYDHSFFHDRGGHLTISPSARVHDLRLGLEYSLRYRRPLALFIDDAQHLAKAASARKLQDQLDTIKSLASLSRTTLVLIGTYELLALRNLSGQLSRRSIDLHFPRYGTTPADLKAFQSLLWAFQRHLPVVREPDLIGHWEYFYVRSAGCVGILRNWLTRTLAATLMDGQKTLTLKNLREHALSISQCEKIAAEAVEGEQLLSRQNESVAHLMKILGLHTTTRGVAASIAEPIQSAIAPMDKKGERPRLPARRVVGERKPHRDPLV